MEFLFRGMEFLGLYINTILSVQLYYEYYKYINDWDTATNQVYQSTGQNNYNYPLAIPSSNQISDQDKIFYYSNYNASSLNFVIKASNFNNSNIYFVYSFNKHVNGIEFDNIGDFMSFVTSQNPESNIGKTISIDMESKKSKILSSGHRNQQG